MSYTFIPCVFIFFVNFPSLAASHLVIIHVSGMVALPVPERIALRRPSCTKICRGAPAFSSHLPRTSTPGTLHPPASTLSMPSHLTRNRHCCTLSHARRRKHIIRLAFLHGRWRLKYALFEGRGSPPSGVNEPRHRPCAWSPLFPDTPATPPPHIRLTSTYMKLLLPPSTWRHSQRPR